MNLQSKEINALSTVKGVFTQTENSKTTYSCNWSAFLQADTIATSNFTTLIGSATISDNANASNVSSCKLTGTPGDIRMVCTITTAAGDTHERFFDITIKDNDSVFTLSQDYGL